MATGIILAALTWATPIGAPNPPDRELAQVAEEVRAFVTETDCEVLFDIVETWKKRPVAEKERLVVALSAHLSNTTFGKLTNPADLIIGYRLKTGDLKAYGHGGVVNHDLFIGGGKAAWAAEELIGVKLSELDEGMTPAERAVAVRDIRATLALYPRVNEYLTEPDCRTLERTVGEWVKRPVTDRARVVEMLAPHLKRTDKPGLTHHQDGVRISYRLEVGDQKHGSFRWSTKQDLFLVGGRAAWAIERVANTNATLPELSAGTLRARDWEQNVKVIADVFVPGFLAGVRQGLEGGRVPPKR